ncbi:MAG TPA: SAM-dependent methyltransferase [Nocardioidaceae bacterium]|nr:SAM-dependent methyltransferase [Nocardioidaceae bacterium]
MTGLPTWRSAWQEALYGAQGFFRREAPSAHFRTSVHASPLFARALVRLAREAGLDAVVDVGAGRGELLASLHAIDPTLTLLGVEVAARPEGLPRGIGWEPVLPASIDGLVVANEWLDNVPCEVVQVDDEGTPRLVHVDPATGSECLGAPVTDPAGPPGLGAWLEKWWPLPEPGLRAEVGTARDQAWSQVVGRIRHGLAVAVDYGHTRDDRPPFGSLRSYREGVEVEVLPDGSRDVTAHVAVDAIAAAVGGRLVRQREELRRLGVSGERPPLDLARSAPASYLSELSRASEAAELTDPAGLGGFFWVITDV